MHHPPPPPSPTATVDDAMTVLRVRGFAWYLGVVLVGLTLLWLAVLRLAPAFAGVAAALLPTVLVFQALSLLVLWRFPRLLRPLEVAQYASFYPVLLGYLALAMVLAEDAAERHTAIATFGVWVPLVLAITFYVFGSRDGLHAALTFVAGTAAVIAVTAGYGARLDGAGLGYVAMLVAASAAFAAFVYGTSRLKEHANAARLTAAVAAQLALRDPLTGVHTRYALEERFDQELARARRGGGPPLATFFLDLDEFKAVNDAYGHATGDAVLRAFAGRIEAVLRASDTIGRMGGDEFVVVASVVGEAQAHALAERMVASCAKPVVVAGVPIDLSVSIGVALYPDDGPDRPALLRAADAALYAAKAAGRNRWSAYPRHAVAGPLAAEAVGAALRSSRPYPPPS